MKKNFKRLTALGMAAAMTASLACAGVPVSAALPESAKQDNDMEVKTYLNEIVRPPENRLVDEGGRTKMSGWDLNQIGGRVEMPTNYNAQLKLVDESPVLPVEAKREFEAITYGDLDFYFNLIVGGGVKDAIFSLREGGTTGIAVGMDASKIWVNTPEGKKELLPYKTDVSYLFYINIHMDAQTFDVYIDDIPYAMGVRFDAKTLDNLFITTGDETVGSITVPRLNFSLKRGHWIDENFAKGNNSILPPKWSLKSIGTSGNETDAPVYHADGKGMRVGGTSGKVRLSKPLGDQNRDFTAEYYMIMPEGCKDASVKFTGGGKDVFEILADENSIYYRDANGNPVKIYDNYKNNVWYIIWAEVSLTNGTFDLYFNDREAAKNIPLPNGANTVDTFTAECKDGNNPFYISLIDVYPTEKFDDYVPEPQVAASDSVDIGMQYFGLWDEGGHFGWEVVEDSDFRFPLDGGYDESSVEHWDWQIKYWTEHGIDYVAPCYYIPGGDTDWCAYMRTPFFKAKYSDKMKYAMIWETAGWAAQEDPKAAMEKWINRCGYNLIEYYFKNPKYYTNGGRPVVFMFGWEDFKKAFGSYASEVLERLGDMCEAEGVGRPLYILHFDIGFDNWDSGSLENAKSLNADAFYHYSTAGANWPGDLMNRNERHLKLARENDMGYVPTISGGFDDYTWARSVGHRYDGEQVRRAVEYYKNNMLSKDSGLAKPMLNLATWNEWGEGHYFGPSKGYGFSFLDAVRDNLTDGGEHTDIIPNEHQKDRFNNLYPYWREIKKREVDVGETPSQDAYEKYVWNFDNSASPGWKTNNTAPSKIENGVWKLTSEKNIIIELVDKGVDTADVTHIKIRMKNKGSGYNVSTKLVTPFWDTGAQNRTMHTELKTVNMSDGDDFIDFYIPVGVYPEFWKGILDGLTIVIDGYSPNESLDIDEIAFMAVPPKSGVAITIDGWTTSDTPVRMQNTMPMTALRDIMYKMKGQTYYDTKTGKVVLKNLEGDIVTEFKPGDATVICNGKEYTLPGSSQIIDGTTFVDAQILSLAADKHASWDNDEKKLTLTDASKKVEIVRPNTDRKLLCSYEFDDMSGIEHVGGMSGVSISNGVAEFLTTNTDPQMSIPFASADVSEAEIISVGLKGDAAYELCLYFETDESPGLSEGKTLRTYVTASNDIVEYTVNPRTNPAFLAHLKKIRVDTGSQIGVTGGIDYVRVYGAFERELTEEEIAENYNCRKDTAEGIVWDFDMNTNKDGWKLSRSLANVQHQGGVMTADVICRDPFIETAEINLGADAAEYGTVKFSLKNSSAATKAKVYFTTLQDPVWSEDKCVELSIADHCGISMAYKADFSQNAAWNGTIRALRIAVEGVEAREERGRLGIDYVKLLKR